SPSGNCRSNSTTVHRAAGIAAFASASVATWSTVKARPRRNDASASASGRSSSTRSTLMVESSSLLVLRFVLKRNKLKPTLIPEGPTEWATTSAYTHLHLSFKAQSCSWEQTVHGMHQWHHSRVAPCQPENRGEASHQPDAQAGTAQTGRSRVTAAGSP